jgi:hypothetical protein
MNSRPCSARFAFAGFAAVATLAAIPATRADPLLDSWQIANSRRYARVYETTADQTSGNAVSTWPGSGLTNMGGGQSTNAYSDVQRVSYSANFVYVNSTGVASYTMGPWYLNTAKTAIFGNWPSASGVLMRFPRTPTVATTKTSTRLGPIALGVNGVVLFNADDAFSYSNSSGQDVTNGDGYWNRDALLSEGATFDPAGAHQPQNGQYHYHVNPIALRFQLNDHVTYNSATNTYAESTGTPSHSPILGWAYDGYPIYGPYGYSDPNSATSGVRRMVSGYVKRDGTNGTTNLTTAGRTVLPQWAVAYQGRSSATLTASEYGPAVSTTRPIGYYMEDYDYLGSLGKTQGVDFDLNQYNVRYCVTPEYPNGTYAYFVSIDSSNAAFFPYVVGPQYYGTTSGGSVSSIAETVTEYLHGGQASAISVTAVNAGGTVTITWSSVEGGTYLLETSPDGSAWTTLAGAVTSAGGGTTSYSTTTVAANYRVTLTALATYSTSGTGGLSGIGNTATATASVGTSGTARLVNISTRAQIGGSAGTPIAGFVISGTAAKTVLVRAVGPTLTSYGVSGALPDPSLSLVSGGVTVASNDDWLASDTTIFNQVGAFALLSGSKDAALVTTLAPGVYSAPVGDGGGSGVTLLEVYDADTTTTGSTLANASTRAFVGTGDSVLIPGFVISGTGTVQLLIRAVGPTLANYGVTGTLADPTITLYQGSTVLATNDNWSTSSNATALAAAAAQVGAFALPSGSKDAALLVTLGAGSYSAVVSGVGNTTGTALVELYVVP